MNCGFLVTRTLNILIYALAPDKASFYAMQIYSGLTLPLQFITNAVMFYPMLLLMKRIRSAFDQVNDKKLWRTITFVPAGFVTIASLFDQFPRQMGFSMDTIHMIFMQAILIFMFFIYSWIFTLIENTRETAQRQSRLEAMVDNYRRAAENTAKIREMQHEMNHHVNALSLYLKTGNYTGAEEYICQLSDLLSDIPAIQYTPHILINSILTEYKQRAEHNGIKTSYQIFVPGSVSMEDIDICRLLTNMLDNAVEACSYVEAGQRYLTLHIRQKGNFLFLSCENSCDGTRLRYENGLPATSKADRSTHGFGLSIMKKLTEKYNGAFRIETPENRFIISVNLCLS